MKNDKLILLHVFRGATLDLGYKIFRPIYICIRNVWYVGVIGINHHRVRIDTWQDRIQTKRYAASVMLLGTANPTAIKQADILSYPFDSFVFLADSISLLNVRKNQCWSASIYSPTGYMALQQNPTSFSIGGILTGNLLCFNLPNPAKWPFPIHSYPGNYHWRIDRGKILVDDPRI
jgi:hypothetical protein